MSKFYRKAAAAFSALVFFCVFVAIVCIKQSYLNTSLVPSQGDEFTWVASAHSDGDHGGESTVVLHESEARLSYTFRLAPKAKTPYAGAGLVFGTREPFRPTIDLSKYSTLSFMVSCSKANTLTVTLNSLDKEPAQANEPVNHRPAMAHFPCEAEADLIEVDLKHMEVPEWWLKFSNLNLADRAYSLNRATHINFGISSQSPINQSIDVVVETLTLKGRAWGWIVSLIVIVLMTCAGFIFWWVKQYTKAMIEMISEKNQENKQLYAKRELTLESQGDKNKNAVLAYMSEAYANPDLNVELAVSVLGINRSKMNGILKEVVGLTFSAYLNKLRLIEAARLLSESDNANVAEIAYSVGYNNVSYFNKLFKDEYACTPKVYKSLLQAETA